MCVLVWRYQMFLDVTRDRSWTYSHNNANMLVVRVSSSQYKLLWFLCSFVLFDAADIERWEERDLITSWPHQTRICQICSQLYLGVKASRPELWLTFLLAVGLTGAPGPGVLADSLLGADDLVAGVAGVDRPVPEVAASLVNLPVVRVHQHGTGLVCGDSVRHGDTSLHSVLTGDINLKSFIPPDLEHCAVWAYRGFLGKAGRLRKMMSCWPGESRTWRWESWRER